MGKKEEELQVYIERTLAKKMKEYKYTKSEDDFECPVTKEIVDIGYCKSFCNGSGCIHIKDCEAIK